MGGLPVREAPLTNTDEKGEICSESVEFAQTFTKCLQYWEMVVRKWAFWLGLWAPDGGGSFDCGLASPPIGGVGLGYSIACTARRRGVSFAPAKETKTGQRGTELSPLQTPLTLGCAGYECCFSALAEKQIRTARRYAPKVACGGSSGATCASIGQTLRYTMGSPLRCGAPFSPHKVLRPCGVPKFQKRLGLLP